MQFYATGSLCGSASDARRFLRNESRTMPTARVSWAANREYGREIAREYPIEITIDGEFTRNEIVDLMAAFELWPSEIETMGTMGGSANPTGWAPAICFDTEGREWIGSLYVTPKIEPVRPLTREHDGLWYTVRDTVIRHFRNA